MSEAVAQVISSAVFDHTTVCCSCRPAGSKAGRCFLRPHKKKA
ncbi:MULTISPECIES: hypothetical protein [Paenibacillus]|nr:MULTISPECIES: hypothetical protein [Paenibacillus]